MNLSTFPIGPAGRPPTRGEMCVRTDWGVYVASDAALPLFPVRYSPDNRYRFTLWRSWAPGPWLAVVGLNPSTATEHVLDPTVSRCVRLAQTTGHGAMCMLNLFGFRSPEPPVMKREADPVGPDNGLALATVLRAAPSVLVAWGSHGLYRGRADEVLDLLALLGKAAVVRCLGTNRDGTPRHPLNTTLGARPEFFPLPTLPGALRRAVARLRPAPAGDGREPAILRARVEGELLAGASLPISDEEFALTVTR